MLKPTPGSLIEQYTKKIEQTEKLFSKIKKVSSALTYQGIERINKVSLFEVKAKHTNEFTIHLGSEYYAEVRAEEAIKLLQHRIKEYQDLLKKIEEKSIQINKKQTKEKIGKEKITNFQKDVGNKNGNYLEVIGQENGQNIYNIVEVEGEQEQNDGDARPIQKQENIASPQFISNSIPSVSYQQKLGQDNLKSQPKNQLLAPLGESNQASQLQEQVINDNESQNDDDDDDDGQEEQTDLIKQYWQKKTNIAPKAELLPIVEKNQEIEPIQIQHPALPVKSSKQNKTKQKQSSLKNEIIKPLPAKISKFKLQKMKEKLLKE